MSNHTHLALAALRMLPAGGVDYSVFQSQVMVFFSSCNSVKYHGELLNYIDVPVKDIHGKQKQQRRTSTFLDFCKACYDSLTVMHHTILMPVNLTAGFQVDSLTANAVIGSQRVNLKSAAGFQP